MRITVTHRRTGEQLDKNILEFENFKPRSMQIDEKWHVILTEDFRAPEIFDDKNDAIREMNGIFRMYLNAKRDEERKALELAKHPINETEED